MASIEFHLCLRAVTCKYSSDMMRCIHSRLHYPVDSCQSGVYCPMAEIEIRCVEITEEEVKKINKIGETFDSNPREITNWKQEIIGYEV